jgi:uncharacterized membrane protein YhaH (DUF805 family)
MNYVIHALRNPFTYTGRASRAEFWLFALSVVAATVALLLFAALGSLVSGTLSAILFAAAGLANLAAVPVLVAVSVRRCHDFGQGGWLVLPMLLLPPIFLICGVLDGHYRTNRYGPRPPALDF